MAPRLKVLMSAYACEPGRGSEPEVGWQWALQAARFHEVTVLTRANNRAVIEAEVAKLAGRQPVPKFIYHDLPPLVMQMKKRVLGVHLYYSLWQRSARKVVAQLLARERFDLLHHLTFVTYRFPTAIWGHGIPCIWGPIAGVEPYPWRLLRVQDIAHCAAEVHRNLINFLQTRRWAALGRRARASTIVLAATPEMEAVLTKWHVRVRLMPAIGVSCPSEVVPITRPAGAPLRLLFSGRLLGWKGLDLALEAVGRLTLPVILRVLGDGPYRSRAQRLAQRLGIANRVIFAGRVSFAEALAAYDEHDVLLFPSLHDSGGFVVIEAMAHGRPVICLDAGGPGLALTGGGGQKIAIGSRNEMIEGIAAAIRRYQEQPALIAEHQAAARRAAVKHYDWNRKGEMLNQLYQEIYSAAKSNRTMRW